MFNLKMLIKYIPLIIGLSILVIIALLTPWDKVGELLVKVPFTTILVLSGLSIIYYVSKAIRFWYILKLLKIDAVFMPVFLLYLSGQPFSLLPAGELYRTFLLHKHLGISMSKSSPSVTVQGLVEAIVLLSLSIIGAIILGQNQIAVGVIAILFFCFIIALQRGWLFKSYKLVNKLPFITLSQLKFQKFMKSHQQLLSARSLATLVAFSLVPVFSGIGILYISSQAIGFDISFIESIIGYSLPVVISGLSFLPGGLGVSEGGSIGMLQLFGASVAAAITITILVRIFTLGAGLLFGVIAQIMFELRKKLV